jgi:hypothetical protein
MLAPSRGRYRCLVGCVPLVGTRPAGNRYFLSEIRLEGSDEAYKLSEGRAEAELRAQNAPASEETLLASLK